MQKKQDLPAWEELYNSQFKSKPNGTGLGPEKAMRAAQPELIDHIILLLIKLIGIKLQQPPSCVTSLNLNKKYVDHNSLNSSEFELDKLNISNGAKIKNTYFFLLIFKPEIIEFFKFGAVGVSGIFVDLIAVSIFKESFNFDVRLCSIFAFPFAVTSNYILNTLWTFKGNQNINFISYIKFFGVNIIGLGVRVWSIHLILMIIPKLGQKFYLPITFLGILVAFFINFLSSKFLVFNKKS